MNDNHTHRDARDESERAAAEQAMRAPLGAGHPLVTAYALGELDGEGRAAERAQVETLLARDEAAREEVERIREVAGELGRELLLEGGRGPAPALSAEQRGAIERELAGAATGGGPAASASSAPRRLPTWLLAAAGLAAVALVVWQSTLPGDAQDVLRRSDPVAMADKEDPLSRLQSMGDHDESARQEAAARDASSEPAALPGSVEIELGDSADEGGAAASVAAGIRSEVDQAETVPVETRPDAESAPAASAPIAAAEGLGAAGEPVHPYMRLNKPSDSAVTQDLEKERKITSVDGSVIVSEPQAVDTEQLQALGYVSGAGEAAPAVPSKAHLTGRGRKDTVAYERMAPGSPVAPPIAPVPPSDGADDRRQPDPCIYWRVQPTPGAEYYAPIVEQGFASPIREPLSTFSIDVDTASYANVRRFLNNGQLPPVDAVRIEELINYFEYDYPAPDGETPFATQVAVTECPWATKHRLVRIGIKGREVPPAERAASNLVFLLDVSGSMDQPDKLPLLVASMKLLVGQLDPRDRVAIVTYAGAAGLRLESTTCDPAGRAKIVSVLDGLAAGGSTAGAAGIQLAYQIAKGTFIPGGTNRVILATDGDFNVGITDRDSLQRLIADSAKSGVFLSVLGFGEGNLKDGTAELLADKGNGNYSYIDSLDEGRRVLVHEMGGTLVTIAKDVKIQVEFNPARVGAYRLIGYENRALAAQDFNDDKKDAGEIGAGHTVTALYEIVPAGVEHELGVDALRYQVPAQLPKPELTDSPDLLMVKLRWKQPDGDTSSKLELPVQDQGGTLAQAGPDASFAAAVAAFGMLLRGSGAAGDASWAAVRELAQKGRGSDADGYRAEFIRLVQVAEGLSPR